MRSFFRKLQPLSLMNDNHAQLFHQLEEFSQNPNPKIYLDTCFLLKENVFSVLNALEQIKSYHDSLEVIIPSAVLIEVEKVVGKNTSLKFHKELLLKKLRLMQAKNCIRVTISTTNFADAEFISQIPIDVASKKNVLLITEDKALAKTFSKMPTLLQECINNKNLSFICMKLTSKTTLEPFGSETERTYYEKQFQSIQQPVSTGFSKLKQPFIWW